MAGVFRTHARHRDQTRTLRKVYPRLALEPRETHLQSSNTNDEGGLDPWILRALSSTPNTSSEPRFCSLRWSAPSSWADHSLSLIPGGSTAGTAAPPSTITAPGRFAISAMRPARCVTTPKLAEHAEGAHAVVRCELCHGPVTLHANLDEGEKIADMPVRRSRELCELCHRELDARPAGFAQVDVREHLTEMGGELTADACFDCHDPHSPI